MVSVSRTQSSKTKPQPSQSRFIDSEFPPNTRSLSRNPHSHLYKYLTFIPISNHPVFQPLPFLSSQSSALSLKSHHLNHEFFISALKVISLYPHLLERMLMRKTGEKTDLYNIMICDTGEWRLLHLDECLLVDRKYKQPAFMMTMDTDWEELWPLLIEKAMAKCLGAYDLLGAGCYEHTMRDLTGASYYKPPEEISNEDLETFLENSLARNDIVTCFPKEEDSNTKLQTIHLITQFLKQRGQHTNRRTREVGQFVKLRSLASNTEQNEEIILDIEHLREKYFEFCSVQLRDSYKYASIRVRHEEVTQHTALKLVIKNQMEVFVSVNQKDARCFVPRTSAEFNYYEEPTPIFKIETVDLNQSDNTSLDISSFSHSPTMLSRLENMDEFLYTYSPVRIIIAKVGQEENLQFVNGTLSRARNAQLTLDLEEGTYIVLVEVHWAQELYKDFTISFYSEDKVHIYELKDFDVEAYVNSIVRDLADTPPEKLNPQIGELETQNYGEAGFPEITRTVGIAAGLMWFYYRNESKTHTLTEDIELLIKNLIIMQSDAFQVVEESPVEAQAEEEETNLQITLGPMSEKYIVMKLTDLEYLCKYRLASQIQLGAQVTPRGKSARPLRPLFKGKNNHFQEAMFGRAEDIPINDLYNDVLESEEEGKKQKNGKNNGNNNKSSNNIRNYNDQNYEKGQQQQQQPQNGGHYRKKKESLRLQDLDTNFEEGTESVGTFGRIGTQSSDDVEKMHMDRISPKFNTGNKLSSSPRNLRVPKVELFKPNSRMNNVSSHEESMTEDGFFPNYSVPEKGNFSKNKPSISYSATTKAQPDNRKLNPKIDTKIHSARQLSSRKDFFEEDENFDKGESVISYSSTRSPPRKRESVKDTLTRVLSERKKANFFAGTESTKHLEPDSEQNSPAVGQSRRLESQKNLKDLGGRLQQIPQRDEVDFERGVYILYQVLNCRIFTMKKTFFVQLDSYKTISTLKRALYENQFHALSLFLKRVYWKKIRAFTITDKKTQKLFEACIGYQSQNLKKVFQTLQQHNTQSQIKSQLMELKLDRFVKTIDLKVKLAKMNSFCNIINNSKIHNYKILNRDAGALLLFTQIREKAHKAQVSSFSQIKQNQREIEFRLHGFFNIIKYLTQRKRMEGLLLLSQHALSVSQTPGLMSPKVKRKFKAEGGKATLNLLKNLLKEKISRKIREAFNQIQQTSIQKAFLSHSHALIFAERLHSLTVSHRKSSLSLFFFALKNYSPIAQPPNSQRNEQASSSNGWKKVYVHGRVDSDSDLPANRQTQDWRQNERKRPNSIHAYENSDIFIPLTERGKKVISQSVLPSPRSQQINPLSSRTPRESDYQQPGNEREMIIEINDFEERDKRHIPVSKKYFVKQTSGSITPNTQIPQESESSVLHRHRRFDSEALHSQDALETTKSSQSQDVSRFPDRNFNNNNNMANLAEELLSQNIRSTNRTQDSDAYPPSNNERTNQRDQGTIRNSSKRDSPNQMKNLQIPPKGANPTINSVSTTRERGVNPLAQQLQMHEDRGTPRTGQLSRFASNHQEAEDQFGDEEEDDYYNQGGDQRFDDRSSSRNREQLNRSNSGNQGAHSRERSRGKKGQTVYSELKKVIVGATPRSEHSRSPYHDRSGNRTERSAKDERNYVENFSDFAEKRGGEGEKRKQQQQQQQQQQQGSLVRDQRQLKAQDSGRTHPVSPERKQRKDQVYSEDEEERRETEPKEERHERGIMRSPGVIRRAKTTAVEPRHHHSRDEDYGVRETRRNHSANQRDFPERGRERTIIYEDEEEDNLTRRHDHSSLSHLVRNSADSKLKTDPSPHQKGKDQRKVRQPDFENSNGRRSQSPFLEEKSYFNNPPQENQYDDEFYNSEGLKEQPWASPSPISRGSVAGYTDSEGFITQRGAGDKTDREEYKTPHNNQKNPLAKKKVHLALGDVERQNDLERDLDNERVAEKSVSKGQISKAPQSFSGLEKGKIQNNGRTNEMEKINHHRKTKSQLDSHTPQNSIQNSHRDFENKNRGGEFTLREIPESTPRLQEEETTRNRDLSKNNTLPVASKGYKEERRLRKLSSKEENPTPKSGLSLQEVPAFQSNLASNPPRKGNEKQHHPNNSRQESMEQNYFSTGSANNNNNNNNNMHPQYQSLPRQGGFENVPAHHLPQQTEGQFSPRTQFSQSQSNWTTGPMPYNYASQPTNVTDPNYHHQQQQQQFYELTRKRSLEPNYQGYIPSDLHNNPQYALPHQQFGYNVPIPQNYLPQQGFPQYYIDESQPIGPGGAHYFRPNYMSSLPESRSSYQQQQHMQMRRNSMQDPIYSSESLLPSPINWTESTSQFNNSQFSPRHHPNASVGHYIPHHHSNYSGSSIRIQSDPKRDFVPEYYPQSKWVGIHSPGNMKMNTTATTRLSKFPPDFVFKMGAMVNILDKLHNFQKIKTMSQALQTLIVHQHKSTLNVQKKLLKLASIHQKNTHLLLSQAFRNWRATAKRSKKQQEPQVLKKTQKERVYQTKGSDSTSTLRKEFYDTSADNKTHRFDHYQTDLYQMKTTPRSQMKIIPSYQTADTYPKNNTDNLFFLPPHHVRTNSAGKYYMVTSSSENSEAGDRDEQPSDLVLKLQNSLKNLKENNAQRLDSDRNDSQGLSQMVKQVQKTLSAYGSPTMSFSRKHVPHLSLELETPKPLTSQSVKNSYSSRFNKNNSMSTSEIREGEKKRIGKGSEETNLLGKSRFEKRNKVRTNIADELLEMKSRMKFLNGYENCVGGGIKFKATEGSFLF